MASVTYAKTTTISVEKTRVELDRLLSKHGATQRLVGVDDARGIAFAGFSLAGRQVKVRVPLPTNADRGTERQLEQRQRSRWRALLLLTKAKLEAVEMGASTIEREFLADISMPDGRSVHDTLAESLEKAYLTGTMRPLLGSGT